MFDNGRLSLSQGAMKSAASFIKNNANDLHCALGALRVGLRKDAPEALAISKNEAEIRIGSPLTWYLGGDGAGGARNACALARGAARRGWSVINVTWNPNAQMHWSPRDHVHLLPEVEDMRSGKAAADLAAAMEKLQVSKSLVATIQMPGWVKISEKEQPVCIDFLRAIGNALQPGVFLIVDRWTGPEEMETDLCGLLRARAKMVGAQVILLRDDMAWTDPRIEDADGLIVGHSHTSPTLPDHDQRIFDETKVAVRIEGEFTVVTISAEDGAFYQRPIFDDKFDRAVDRLQRGIDAGKLETHTHRLNAVARACGYADWHAAQGRKPKGLLTKVKAIFDPISNIGFTMRLKETGKLFSVESPLLWITGAPGCGKTKLVASLQLRALSKGGRCITISGGPDERDQGPSQGRFSFQGLTNKDWAGGVSKRALQKDSWTDIRFGIEKTDTELLMCVLQDVEDEVLEQRISGVVVALRELHMDQALIARLVKRLSAKLAPFGCLVTIEAQDDCDNRLHAALGEGATVLRGLPVVHKREWPEGFEGIAPEEFGIIRDGNWSLASAILPEPAAPTLETLGGIKSADAVSSLMGRSTAVYGQFIRYLRDLAEGVDPVDVPTVASVRGDASMADMLILWGTSFGLKRGGLDAEFTSAWAALEERISDSPRGRDYLEYCREREKKMEERFLMPVAALPFFSRCTESIIRKSGYLNRNTPSKL